MRIAFTGSSSTGKTTLAKELSLLMSQEKYLTVDARSIIESFNIHNVDDFSNKTFMIFQKEWINKKIAQEKNTENFITDRSYIDPLAYMRSRDIIDNDLFNKCVSYMNIYDFVFYIPYGKIKFETDGYRSNNPEHNKIVDYHIKSLLDEYKINYYTVEEVSVKDRLKYIRKILKNNE